MLANQSPTTSGLDKFTANILQRIPQRHLHIPFDSIQNDEQYQHSLLATLQTISLTNPFYAKQTLESLLGHRAQTVISGDLMDSYYDLLSTLLFSKPLLATDPDLIQYNITPQISIKVWETPMIISGAGTTGFRTWEASLFLCEYLAAEMSTTTAMTTSFKGDHKFNGLELGCGTGIVSMFILKFLQSISGNGSVCLTDGDSSLIEKLAPNLTLNDITATEAETEIATPETSITHKSQRLWWGEDSIPENVDIIYAADVTYDSSVIPSLVTCITQALTQGVKYCLIAATIRNEDTIRVFELALDQVPLRWEIVQERETSAGGNYSNISGQAGLVWYAEGTPAIKIYKIEL
ncbi:hypothetical protein WICPIJ_007449 [Wickerhamomyces pijperi]|uniref:FAM86 N-terminal domain-containing protein n=1 Tax=Wickerhamomyces pijperi TaxID=599730 RepID=A0A9P8TK22_WICPI|nr:hypothetical protein WICPIJ_007449 [Wickerhamomyces pijperi]